MAFLSSLVNYGNKALDWYNNNPIISDVAVPGLATLYNQYQQNSANKTATGQMTAGIEQGLASLNQFYGTARQDAAPYMASGLQGLSQYQGLLANPNAVKESEDYKFRFAEGQQALERSAAAKGMLMSGNTLQELQQYGQGFATRELDAALQRRIPLMETGLTSQRSLAELGQGYANAIAELYGQRGDVAALGARTGANTTTGTLQDTLGILSDLNKARTAVEGASSLLGTGTTAATNLSALGTAGATTAGSALAAMGGPGGAAQVAGMLPAGSQYTGMLSAMDALGAGTGIPGAAGGATGGGASGLASLGGSTASPSALAVGSVYAVPFLMAAISKFGKGGSAESAKSGKFAQQLQRDAQADPTGRTAQQTIDRLLTGKLWPGEGNQWVISDLMKSGVVSLNTPSLYSGDSVVDVFMNPNELMSMNTSNINAPAEAKIVAMGAGMTQAQADQYALKLKQYLNYTNNEPESIRGRNDMRRLRNELGQFNTQIMQRQRDNAQRTYTTLRSGGYTGDLSKLETYLRIK